MYRLIRQDEDFSYIIMEFCEMGDLSDFIQKYGSPGLSEGVALEFMRQIVAGKRDMAAQDIVHVRSFASCCDLNVANVCRSADSVFPFPCHHLPTPSYVLGNAYDCVFAPCVLSSYRVRRAHDRIHTISLCCSVT